MSFGVIGVIVAANKLSKLQRLALLEWLSAEYETNVIKGLASVFDPPFQVSKRQLNYYRKRYGPDIQRMREERRTEAISRGLALREERVARGVPAESLEIKGKVLDDAIEALIQRLATEAEGAIGDETV